MRKLYPIEPNPRVLKPKLTLRTDDAIVEIRNPVVAGGQGREPVGEKECPTTGDFVFLFIVAGGLVGAFAVLHWLGVL